MSVWAFEVGQWSTCTQLGGRPLQSWLNFYNVATLGDVAKFDHRNQRQHSRKNSLIQGLFLPNVVNDKQRVQTYNKDLKLEKQPAMFDGDMSRYKTGMQVFSTLSDEMRHFQAKRSKSCFYPG